MNQPAAVDHGQDALQSAAPIRTAAWRDSFLRRAAARAAYPLIWAINRPSAAVLARAIYDFALRCNGIAINFKGQHGLNRAEERFLDSVAPRLQGGVLLDVGANYGSYADYLSRIAPTARIHAFEPHPRTFKRLAQHLSGKDVTLVQQALSDQPGELELFDFADGDGSTQASLSQEAVGFFADRMVRHAIQSTTLDDYMEQAGIDRVDFLKIDTEGFDLNVLKGAQRAIRDRRIGMIQFEFIPANIATRVTMRDFFAALPGYEIHRLCLNGSLLPLFPYDVKRCEIYVTQNLIALPA
ncbi:FkbM family methyltransferase [Roseomonas indoligenes]|uniref:FkbM family methyltransferase n=1 Tax=Roseomonas indoligenes TaxID=2820811 RepID=A0A940N2P3_9PROT|nr:FkbM family methyltransferase [Pararoseomonas indoligenes]MBP0496118.1 FkbM family methyltransferase [Pararoseomonas indoligenes]